MNREVRFRAWDGKCLRPVTKLPSLPFETKQGNVTFMQFTGLVDKNGREIYEGDIVHYIYQPGPRLWNCDAIHVVEWKSTGFHMSPISGGGINAWLIAVPGAYMPNCQRLFEVIGNVHENPELVEAA